MRKCARNSNLMLRSIKMKKLLSILLSILLVSAIAFSVVACGETEESVDETVSPVSFVYKTTTDDDGNDICTLTEFSVSAAAKAYIDEKDFAGLKALFEKHADDTVNFTFDDENNVTLTIPEKITHLATNAIANQTFIKHIVVGSHVEEIELGAFSGLSSLESITLPFIGAKKGAVNGEKLFGHIFGTVGGSGLTAITQNYNDGSSENTETFQVPTSLKKVVITGDVTTTEITYNYYIENDKMYVIKDGETAPEGVTVLTWKDNDYSQSAMQPYAFHGISMVETVVFEGAITAIPDFAFYGCTAIKALDFTDSGIETIGKYAYANCTSIRTLKLGSVTTILENAFNACAKLGKSTATQVNVIDFANVTEIGKDAFVGCALTEKSIKNLSSEIDKDAVFGEDVFAE